MRAAHLLYLMLLLLLAPRVDAQQNDLLAKIWGGVQRAQDKTQTACGNLVETRSSALMTKPMTLRGKFCAEGLTHFWLEYTTPISLRIRFNTDYLNIVTAGGTTEVLKIGSGVRRAQAAFSREKSIAGLKKNFYIEAEENAREYEMKFTPRSEAFRRRLNYLAIRLNKQDFLPRLIEVDGKNGVHSAYAIEITAVNSKLPAQIFEVQKDQ